MSKRLVSAILSVVLLLSLIGCDGKPNAGKLNVSKVTKAINKAQAVVALSPVLSFDDGTAVVAFNDVKNAIQNDRKAATLSSLFDSTEFCLAYKSDDGWKKRGIWGLDKWRNGKGASISTLNSYFFNDDGTDSLMAFTSKAAKFDVYDDSTVPDYGLVFSTSESGQEALIYTVPSDGNLTIQQGSAVAIKSIDGVKTGFLAEDEKERSAILRIDINSRRYFSGKIANSVASEDGTVTASVDYPEVSDIPVSEGDLVIFSLEFNGQLNHDDQITLPSDSKGKNHSGTSSGSSDKSDKEVDKSARPDKFTFLNGFDSRFQVIYPSSASTDIRVETEDLGASIEKVLKAETKVKSDGWDKGDYEILIGETNRDASKRAYEDLRNARTNHAADYIIRMDGNDLVVAGGSDFALLKAIKIVKGYCTSTLSAVPSDLNVVFREEKANRMLGVNNVASYVIRTERYPSYMVKQAAQMVQNSIMELTGYLIPIERDEATSKCEILIGPNARGTTNLVDKNAYDIKLSGNSLSVSVGSTTAANMALSVLCDKLKSNDIPDGFTLSGSYSDGAYTLSNGYGLTWSDDFEGTKLDRSKWVVMTDTTDGPYYKISDVADRIARNIGGPWLNTTLSGDPVPEGYVMEGKQTRPGVEGENFYLNDGKLFEVTRKVATGYDAVRLYTSNKMRYRYGFTEVRIKMATNNGACSSVWLSLNGNEIDVYENYGLDAYFSNLHTWRPTHIDHVGAGNMAQVWVYPEAGRHFYDEYHYIGFEWTDTRITFYLDGEVTNSVDISDSKFALLRQLISLKLANGVGTGNYSSRHNPGDYLGDAVDSFREVQEVDFVRIYQKDSSKYKMLVG